VRACFGDRCLEATLLVERSPKNQGETVELRITAQELHRDPPDLSTQLRVYHHPSFGVPNPEMPRFGGYVTDLERLDDTAWRVTAHNMANFREYRIAGLGIRNVSDADMVYAMARSAGMPPERIHIAGWQPVAERLLVVVPVDGMAGLGGLDVSDSVGITSDAAAAKTFDLGPTELQEGFMGAGHWATGIFAGRTMYDVERFAVSVFERVIRRLSLAARFTSAETPDGTLRDFSRSRLLEEIQLRPIAGVMGLHSNRTWLHGYELMRAEAVLDPGVLTGLGAFIGAPDGRTDEAIAAWRRASMAEDASVAVVALAEAIEFYAAETKIPKLFSKQQLAAIRASVRTVPLDDKREQRLADMIGRLNEPSLNLRLQAAMDADGVRYSEPEFDLLTRFRDLRNKILHGQKRELPNDDELREALSLVNRLLLVRLKRVRQAASTAD
jgi:hypothetical protein